jgi:sugar lactone lactonase YvrE
MSERSSLRRVARLGLLAFLLALFVLAWHGQHQFQYRAPRARGGWILLVAMALLIALIVLARRIVPPPSSEPALAGDRRSLEPPNPWTLGPYSLGRRAEWFTVALLFLLGTAFRLVHFSTVPEGINHDSAWYGLYAIHITQGAEYTPYISAAWGRETLFMYIVAPFLWIFGNSPEALQAASTLCGIAALLPLYALVRVMFGAQLALLALAFLAVSGWHVVFSRVGWRVITVPPFEILALYGAWQATERGWWRDWMILGAGAALSIYTYNAGRIVPLLCATYFLLFFPGRSAWRGYVLGGILALMTFTVVGGPMLWYAATHFEQFQGRADYLTLERETKGGVLHNWWTAAAMFNYAGNGNDFFVREPLLGPMAAVLFLLGLAAMLVRLRQRQSKFILLGLAVSLVPGILAVPNGNRCITALPFVCVLIATGASTCAQTGAALVGRRARVAAAWLFLAVMVGMSAGETYAEFLGPRRRPLYGISPDATAAGLFMRRHRDRYKIYTISSWPEDTMTYLSHNGRGSPFERYWMWVRSFDEAEKEIDVHGAKGLLFLTDLQPAGTEAFARLEKRFPEHRTEWLPPPRGGDRPVARAFFVERAALGRSGLWSNFSRSLFLHGGTAATEARATRCFETAPGVKGLSLRVRLMLPEVREARAVGGVYLLDACDGDGAPLVGIEMTGYGLTAAAAGSATLVPWARLEAGRWYDVYATLKTDHSARVTVEGMTPEATTVIALDPARPITAGAVRVLAPNAAEPGGELYVDDVTLLAGVFDAGDPRWVADKRGEGITIVDDSFDDRPFGPLVATSGWRDVVGAVTVANSPGVAHAGTGVAGDVRNAFDASEGSEPGQFKEPMGVAADPRGNFYVSERLNNRIQKFAADGTFISMWGKEGSEPGELREPMDLTADEQFLYVADTWNHRIQVYDWNGTPLFVIRGEPTLSSPRGIFARDGRIYLADSGRGWVRIFDRSGKQLQIIGESGGDAPKLLQEPVDVVADRNGRIYVVNSGHNRIEIFAADGTPNGFFPIPGWTGTNLKEGYLAIDGDDLLHLSDPVTSTILRFKTDGTELPAISIPRLTSPAGLAVVGDQLIVTARRAHGVKAVELAAQ